MPPLPEVTKNLIILNVLFFLGQGASEQVTLYLALHPWGNDYFEPYQLVTHMFLHGNLSHIFFNMFGVYMFGSAVEYTLGPKRFLIFYLACGLGAAFLHSTTLYWELQQVLAQAQSTGDQNLIGQATQAIYHSPRFPTVGASGAVFGLLAAFGMLYPNRVIMLLFPPIPMKAKYFVIIYAGFELYLGVRGASSQVAHFAHVGGALFGALLILLWRMRGERF